LYTYNGTLFYRLVVFFSERRDILRSNPNTQQNTTNYISNGMPNLLLSFYTLLAFGKETRISDCDENLYRPR